MVILIQLVPLNKYNIDIKDIDNINKKLKENHQREEINS